MLQSSVEVNREFLHHNHPLQLYNHQGRGGAVKVLQWTTTRACLIHTQTWSTLWFVNTLGRLTSSAPLSIRIQDSAMVVNQIELVIQRTNAR